MIPTEPVTPPPAHCTCPPLCTDELRCEFCRSNKPSTPPAWTARQCEEYVHRIAKYVDDHGYDAINDPKYDDFTAELAVRYAGPAFGPEVIAAAETIVEPVTEEWLRSIGFHGGEHPDKWTIRRPDALSIGLWKVEDGWKAMLIHNENAASCLVRKQNTRGAVRQLLAALGIPPAKEPINPIGG